MATKRNQIATVRVKPTTAAPGTGLDVPTKDVKDMGESWPMIESLMGGTAAMRKDGMMLFREPRESRADFDYRQRTATLYPAMERTVQVMAGKPFSKQIVLSEDTSGQVKKLCENIDNQGRSVHSFASDVFGSEVMPFGICGILVDQPTIRTAPGIAPTLADVKAQKVRPYWTKISHGDIIGWREANIGGTVRLTQLRLREQQEVEDGPYAVKKIDCIRVLVPGYWELWKKDTEGNFQLGPDDQGPTGLGYIPYQPCYGKRLGFMKGVSPLLNLAFLNVKHYQQQSDQDDSARFARKRLLVFFGVDVKDLSEIEASSSSAIAMPQEGKVEVVQGSSESVEVGRGELATLEEQMVRTGAELVVKSPSGGGDRTATQDNNEAEGNKSELQRIVEDFEDALDNCLQFTADFLALGEGTGGHVTLFKDFGAANLTEASAQLILALQSAGLITRETALREQQRRGMISPDINIEDELERAADEGMALGEMGLDPTTGRPPPPAPPLDPNKLAPDDPRAKQKPPPPAPPPRGR